MQPQLHCLAASFLLRLCLVCDHQLRLFRKLRRSRVTLDVHALYHNVLEVVTSQSLTILGFAMKSCVASCCLAIISAAQHSFINRDVSKVALEMLGKMRRDIRAIPLYKCDCYPLHCLVLLRYSQECRGTRWLAQLSQSSYYGSRQSRNRHPIGHEVALELLPCICRSC